MSYHIVCIDSPKCYIGCKHRQLVFRDQDGAEKQLPLEDVAAVVVSSFSPSIHGHLLIEAANAGTVFLFCDGARPASVLLPVNRASDTVLLKAALDLDKKKCARLWRKTVDAKCLNQLTLARAARPRHPDIDPLARTARGKSAAKESTTARYYWGVFRDAISDAAFRRAPDAPGANNLLNYGYGVLLATVLQRLLAVGLDPVLGIGHAPRERSTPLAYDIMEPFRPCVDARVLRWVRLHPGDGYEISKECRRFLASVVLDELEYDRSTMRLNRCVELVVRSFRKAVVESATQHYKPWTATDSKWAGC